MTRPQRHPRRPARPRPRPRSSIWKRAPSCSIRRGSSWPPSTWRQPIVIATSSRTTSERCSTPTSRSWPGCRAARSRRRRWPRIVRATRRSCPRPRLPCRPRRPVTVAAPPPAVAAPAAPVAANPAAMPTSPAEIKQRGRWLLHEGREQLLRGNYDLAQQKVDEVRALDVRWGLFDDTPDKLEQDVAQGSAPAGAGCGGRRIGRAPRSPHGQGEAPARPASC